METYQFQPKPIIALRGYTRNGSFPLDNTSLFDSYLEALDYVQNSNIAYPGQIISVDDHIRKKVNVYQVAYDSAIDAIYPYYLEEISVGTNALGYFNFKGKLESKDELDNLPNPQNKDMYFVKIDNEYKTFVYLESKWEEVSLGIGLASKTNDGIITKELYKQLSGAAYSGLYYHPGATKVLNTTGMTNTPEQARFIKLITAENDTLEIQTSDKIKETLFNIIGVEEPNVEIIITSHNLENVYIGQILNNIEVRIFFYPKLSGGISNKGSLFSAPSADYLIFNNKLYKDSIVPLSKSDFTYNYEEKRYELNYPIIISQILIHNDEQYIEAHMQYDGNADTLYNPGSSTSIFYFKTSDILEYNYGYYKYNLSEPVYVELKSYGTNEFIKLGEVTKVSMQNTENGICRFTFKTPHKIKQMTYVSQNDNEFLNLMTEKFIDDYYVYIYDNKYPIKSKLEFLIQF